MVEKGPKLIKKDQIVKGNKPVLDSNAAVKRAQNDPEQAMKDLKRKLTEEMENSNKKNVNPYKDVEKLFKPKNG